MSRGSIRALVIDDSAYNRKTLTELLRKSDVEVVGGAGDGEEGLRLAMELEPDVITLDLEMPRMDGFTFLRILMSKAPTPVVVVSSYANKSNVFRALELGAVDFVAKPSRFITGNLDSIGEELLQKIRTVRGLRLDNLKRPGAPLPPHSSEVLKGSGPLTVVAIGASTGGPPALQHILGRLPVELNIAMVIAQHMPERFTLAFAERLDKSVPFTVREAASDDLLERGQVLIAPGGQQMRVVNHGGEMKIRLGAPEERDLYVPSIDTLLKSVAEAAESCALGIVLTGMGRDGSQGIAAIKEAGGATMVESESTAVIYGMPAEAVASGKVDQVLPIDEIPSAIIDHVVGSSLHRARREG